MELVSRFSRGLWLQQLLVRFRRVDDGNNNFSVPDLHDESIVNELDRIRIMAEACFHGLGTFKL